VEDPTPTIGAAQAAQKCAKLIALSAIPIAEVTHLGVLVHGLSSVVSEGIHCFTLELSDQKVAPKGYDLQVKRRGCTP
jgi:hypothetical protein